MAEHCVAVVLKYTVGMSRHIMRTPGTQAPRSQDPTSQDDGLLDPRFGLARHDFDTRSRSDSDSPTRAHGYPHGLVGFLVVHGYVSRVNSRSPVERRGGGGSGNARDGQMRTRSLTELELEVVANGGGGGGGRGRKQGNIQCLTVGGGQWDGSKQIREKNVIFVISRRLFPRDGKEGRGSERA